MCSEWDAIIGDHRDSVALGKHKCIRNFISESIKSLSDHVRHISCFCIFNSNRSNIYAVWCCINELFTSESLNSNWRSFTNYTIAAVLTNLKFLLVYDFVLFWDRSFIWYSLYAWFKKFLGVFSKLKRPSLWFNTVFLLCRLNFCCNNNSVCGKSSKH